MVERKLNSDYEVKELFSNPAFVGDVLRYSTLLEYDLDCALIQYFIRDDRIELALNELLPEIALGRKIELLAGLSIRKSITSHSRAIIGLRRFQRVRNIVAHNWAVTLSQIRKLLVNADYHEMIRGYPSGMETEFRSTRNALDRLIRIHEFRNPHTNKPIEPGDLAFDKIFL